MVDVILIEASPRGADDGQPATVRLAGGGADRPYYYAGEHWRAGITGLPRSVSTLDFNGGELGGGGVPSAMQIVWQPASRAALADLAARYWIDAPITVRIGPEGDALPPIETAGVVLAASVDEGAVKLVLADAAADLKRPLIVDHFTGAGGAEGPEEWAGRVKRRAWGRCFNVRGELIDKALNVWCFGDPARPWRAIDAVRERGIAADPVHQLAWQGSVAATFGALRNAIAPEGGCVVCPSIACVKWWTRPTGDLYIDLRGEIGGGYVETAPEIVGRIVAERSALTIAANEVAEAAAARPAIIGCLVGDDTSTAASVVSDLLGQVSLSWVVDGGQIAFRRWEWSAPVRVARSHRVERQQIMRPVGARRLGYRRNWFPMSKADIAATVLAKDVVYDDGTTGEDWKPAQPGADVTGKNTSKDTNAVGGRPAPVILEAVDKIEPMVGDLAATKRVTEAQGRALEALRSDSNVAFDLLDAAGLEKDTALRSLDLELQRLGKIALSSLVDQEETRRIMRDAGISVDPASGAASIWAIEQLKDQTRKVELTIDAQAAEIRQKVTVDRVEEMILLAQLDPGQIAELEPLIRRVTSVEQVASGLLASLSAKAEAAELTRTTARLTTVSQELDALAGTVDLKASRLDVDAQGARLTQIGQQLAAMPDGARLSVELTQVRSDVAAGQVATLDALLAGEEAADRRIVEMAQYRQEVIARIDAGLAVEVAERRSLAAAMGGIDVRLSADLRGLVTATGGTARQVAALEVASEQQRVQIGDLREATLDAEGGIATLQTTVRQMGPRADAADLATLGAMLDAEERGVEVQRQLAQVQQEATTRFVVGERSAAATRLLLEARIGANDARIGQTAEAVATLGRSTASRIDAIDVRFGRLTDDVAASQAIVTRELAALVEKDRAIVADVTTLSTEVRDPNTGLSKTRADLLAEVKLSADDRGSLARAYNALAAIVNDPATGLERTRSQMLAEIDLSATDRAALARKYDALQGIVMDSSGNPYWVGSIADLRKIVIDGDKLLSERVDTVQGTVGDNTASVAFLRRVIDGKEAYAQLAVDVNGKISGFSVDGVKRVFAIAADRFIVGDSQIFEVDATTGETRMKSAAIGAATIDTLNLKDGSLTEQVVGTPQPFTVAMAGAGTGTRTADSEVTRIVTTGRRVRIDIQAFTRTEIDARWDATIRLMRQTASGTVQIGRAMPIGAADLTLGWWEIDRPAAGEVGYFLRAELTKTTAGLAQVDFSSIQIAIEETKK